MARSTKPISMVQGHRVKAEKEARAKGEADILTGCQWEEYAETRNNAIAHKFFTRLTFLFGKIEKNDAMSEQIINRYCMIQAECYDFERKREVFSDNLDALIDNDTMEDKDKFRIEAEMQKSILGVDSAIQAKRKMLLDIERETLMTLKAQLASIPKKPQKEQPKNKFTVFGGERLG